MKLKNKTKYRQKNRKKKRWKQPRNLVGTIMIWNQCTWWQETNILFYIALGGSHYGGSCLEDFWEGSEIFKENLVGSEINFGFFTNTGSKLSEMQLSSDFYEKENLFFLLKWRMKNLFSMMSNADCNALKSYIPCLSFWKKSSKQLPPL